MSVKRARAVTAVNGAVAAALVAALAAVALVVRPPAPPGIAEFAPKASRPITKAPAGQAAAGGLAQGGCVQTQPCAVPTPSPTAVGPSGGPLDRGGAPSALQCYTWLDGSVTQTFDPQSPPCVASWPERAQGNGGATAMGVSATEVRVAVPGASSRTTRRVAAAYAAHVNSHFELYGRKIRLAFFDGPIGRPSAQRATGKAAAALRPFAALQINGSVGDTRPYEDAVIGGGAMALRFDTLESVQPRRDALFWSYFPQMDVIERNLAAFLCRTLPPRAKAAFAGPPEAGKPRKFGVIRSTYQDGRPTPDVKPLVDGLRACADAPVVVQVPYPYEPSTYQAVVLNLRRQGVTSVVVFDGASFIQLRDPMTAASQVGYQPEWVEPGLTYYSASYNMNNPIGGSPTEQLAHLLGLSALSKPVSLAERPYGRAYRETYPGQDPGDIVSQMGATGLYSQLLLLAAGIQAAGPRLTATSFQAALEQLRFPNPGAGGAPSFQGSVGFDEDHSMVRDVAVWSWDSNRRDPGASPADPPGTRCYAERGKRWRLGTWPSRPIAIFQRGGPC